MDNTPTVPGATIVKSQWDGLTVVYGRLDAVGDFDFAMPKQAISVVFAPHDQVTWSIDGKARQTANLVVAGAAAVVGDGALGWAETPLARAMAPAMPADRVAIIFRRDRGIISSSKVLNPKYREGNDGLPNEPSLRGRLGS